MTCQVLNDLREVQLNIIITQRGRRRWPCTPDPCRFKSPTCPPRVMFPGGHHMHLPKCLQIIPPQMIGLWSWANRGEPVFDNLKWTVAGYSQAHILIPYDPWPHPPKWYNSNIKNNFWRPKFFLKVAITHTYPVFCLWFFAAARGISQSSGGQTRQVLHGKDHLLCMLGCTCNDRNMSLWWEKHYSI